METTFGRFYNEIRSFISDLFRDPIMCVISDYLKERGFTKKKLVSELIKRGILGRSEKVTDSTDSDNQKPTYTIKYSLYKDNFEKKVKRLYIKYFEKNLPEKKETEINEEGGGASGCSNVGGAFEGPLKIEPIKRMFVTESQFQYIMDIMDRKAKQ